MLGENIYKLRKKQNLSQEELAEKIKVTRQTISNWELGETNPNPEQLKLLSKELGITIDELVGNDIKNVLVEKVSNTEQLAGIIIKILRIIGITFLILIIIDIVALILFTFLRKDMVTEITEEITVTCSKQEKEYLISVGSDGYFNCSNCSEKIQKDLKELVDYSNINNNLEIITEYFEDNNGTCE